MKIKELFNKLKIANELNKLTFNEELEICLVDRTKVKYFNNYKEFKIFIQETYIKEVVEILLNANCDLGNWQSVEYVDILGNLHAFNFKFLLEIK